MRKNLSILMLTLSLFYIQNQAFSQGVMISNDPAAPQPSALLQTFGLGTGDGNVLFMGEWKSTPGPVPALNAGTRMMWYPDKSAFRAGRVTSNQWNTENIGNYSTASGLNTTASGSFANAWGSVTTASGAQATTWGFNNIASGASSTAWGENTTAPSFAETVFGFNNTVYTPASSTAWVATDRLFVIGNGSSGNSDALVMLKNGNMGLGTSSPTQRLEVAGSIYGQSSNWAIRGVKTGTTGTFPGVWGETESGSANANGIRGFANNTTSGSGSAGVFGKNFSTTNANFGVLGEAVSVSGRGVYGYASSATGTNYGVYGRSDSPDGFGVYGEAISVLNYGTGGYFRGNRIGVSTLVEGNGFGDLFGIRAVCNSTSSSAITYAGYFSSQSQFVNYSIYSTTGSSNGNYAGYFVGNIVVLGTINGPSDQMFKRNIREMDSSLDKIIQLKGKTYENKTDEYSFMNLPAGSQHGFIAQELEQVFPELVNDNIHPGTDPNNKNITESRESLSYKGINYIGLIPVLVKAIQEQQDLINKQQQEIDQLKKQMQKRINLKTEIP
jgi:hypothetical protein